MEFKTGKQYDLINPNTKQRAGFTIDELFEYKGTGHYLVYGFTGAHDIYLPAIANSRPEIEPRPSAFPLINADTPADLITFCEKLYMPVPWILFDSLGQGVHLANQYPVPGYWKEPWLDKSNLLGAAQSILDLYMDWQRRGRGRLNRNYLQAVRKVKAGVS